MSAETWTRDPDGPAAEWVQRLSERIESRAAQIGVVGMGYVGLPLAVALAETGFSVTGVDVDAAKVAEISAGRSTISDVDDARLAPVLDAGRLLASTDYAALADCDAVFVCVPTPFDQHKTPDLSYVIAAAEGLAAHLKGGGLVILESTTYPGTTEEVIQPRLEQAGLRVGQDLFLAFSPERIDPGVPEHTVAGTPKVVGGVTPDCTALAAQLLGTIAPLVHPVSSARVAEMCKLLENIFRSVNIALVNELALLSERMGIDVWEVIEAAATKPFGYMPFWPGAGVGGHCIPVDPHYLSWKAREFDFSTRFIELAADINQGMPAHAVALLTQALGQAGLSLAGARVLVLGVAFKPNVEDPRNSPAERVIELLLARGAELQYHDPHVPRFRVGGSVHLREQRWLESSALDDATVAQADALLILTAHDGLDYAGLCQQASLVVDTTRATEKLENPPASLQRLGAPRPQGPARHPGEGT